jgi:transketolase
MRNTFVSQLLNIALDNEKIMLLTGDLGFGVVEEFQNKLPNQFLNCGVAEQNMTAVASGLAMTGMIPFTYSIGNFPTLRCLEHIRNDVAYHKLSVKIVSIGAGFSYGQLGMSHHSTEDLSIMRSIPELSVYSPCSIDEVKMLVPDIITKDGPGYLRLDKSIGITGVDSQNYSFEKATSILEGNDITVLSTGAITSEVYNACKVLNKEDSISCDFLSVHSIKPIDKKNILKSINKTKKVITVEEHSIVGGLGSAVAEICSEECIELLKFKRIGLKDEFSSIVGDQNFLRKYYRLDSKSVYNEIKKLVKE